MIYNQQIQVRSTRVISSVLRVDIAPYDLSETLQVTFGMLRQWHKMPKENHYACQVTLQLVAQTEAKASVLVAEAVMEQVSEVVGYSESDLLDAVELRLPEILMPYVRAQVSSLLLQSGYPNLAFPVQLEGTPSRATNMVPSIPEVAAL